MTFEWISYLLILISAVMKGLALYHLSQKSFDFPTRQKRYMRFNMLCYLFLLPGVLLWAYLHFVA